MGFLFNFNMPMSKRFNYRPLYYDADKERLEKMKARAEAEAAAERNKASGASVNGLQKGFLSANRAKSKGRHAKLERASILRFFIILLAIIGILYFVMPEEFLEFWKIKKII